LRGIGVGFHARARDVFFSIPPLWSTGPPKQSVPAVLSLGLKQQEHESVHSSPCSADVKNDEAKPRLPITSSLNPGTIIGTNKGSQSNFCHNLEY
jgi:hypothetical protein